MKKYVFVSITSALLTCQRQIINDLHDYGLLTKFTKDVKKIITYHLIHQINGYLKNRKVLLWHDHKIDGCWELLSYYPPDKLNNFIDKLALKIKKLTNRLIFLKIGLNDALYPDVLNGEIVDEIILLNNQKPSDPKKLKEFLSEYNLGELFDSFQVHLS